MNSARGHELENVAYRLGMEYQYGEEWGIMPYLQDFNLFRIGRGRKITHMLYTQDEWLESRVFVFDYVYRSGKNRRKHYQTVFFVESKDLGLPQFFLKPEHFFHQVGELLGLTQDIDFEEHPEFSKRYWLKGDDEDYIRHTFNKKVRHFFTVEKNWSLEGINYYMIFYKRGRLLPAKDIKEFYEKGMALVKMLSQKTG
jgi:hypothetical protein